MSKSPKRPGRTTPDVHERIRLAAEAMRQSPTFQVRDADEFPEVAALMDKCRTAVEKSIPACVLFEGRVYFMRVKLSFMLDIYGSAGAAQPLLSGASFSTAGFGHRPGH